jgi:hypothetical protein
LSKLSDTKRTTRNQSRVAPKLGGGNSSGLGEFWNNELANNGALSIPFPFFNNVSISVISDVESSSEDMWNTPSLGARL